MTKDPSVRIQDDSYIYFEKTETCTGHEGVRVTYLRSKYEMCPLCAALCKVADDENDH